MLVLEHHAEGAADQADSDNNDVFEVRRHEPTVQARRPGNSGYSSRPTASAIFLTSCISSLNLAGLIDSSPSHSAHSGLECTSISRPSAPAATAALAMGA